MSASSPDTRGVPDRQPVVVLVEDDDVDALAFERAFARHAPGFERFHTSTAEAALGTILERVLGGASPCVVVLDLRLPRMGGLDLLLRLQGQPWADVLTVFVLTTSDDPRDKSMAAELGVAGYYVKGTDDRSACELARRLDAWLRAGPGTAAV